MQIIDPGSRGKTGYQPFAVLPLCHMHLCEVLDAWDLRPVQVLQGLEQVLLNIDHVGGVHRPLGLQACSARTIDPCAWEANGGGKAEVHLLDTPAPMGICAHFAEHLVGLPRPLRGFESARFCLSCVYVMFCLYAT